MQMKSKIITKRALLFLGIGLVLYFFSNGNWTLPVATWLAPLFLLRYLDSIKPASGLVILFFLMLPATYIMLYGIIPPWLGFFALILTIYYTFLTFMPYLVYKLFVGKDSSFLSTLIFPCAGVSFEYLNNIFWGSWHSLAYTQFENLPLIQMVSLSGIWGVTFLILWFGSLVNWIWKRQFAWSQIKTAVFVYTSVFVIVLLYGGVRLAIFNHHPKSIKITSFTPSAALESYRAAVKNSSYESVYLMVRKDRTQLRKILEDTHQQIFAKNKELISSGADLYLWPEGCVPVLAEVEGDFIAKGVKLARSAQIRLLIAYYLVPEKNPERLGENKCILINPEGKIEWHYLKSFPVPGSRDRSGDGIIPVSQVAAARIGTAICYDMDFTGFIHQAGKKNIDIMLVPAWDWRAIDPLHSRMAAFRAIENGFSLVRQTGEGLSIAVDPFGRTLAMMDHFTTTDHTMISQVPLKGIKTLYAYLGDWFAWASIIWMVMALVIPRFRKKMTK